MAGNSFPRLSARRRIPRAALELKKYLGWINSAGCKTSDSEDSTASLWYSGKLRVKNPVGDVVEPPCCDSAASPPIFRNCWNVSGKSCQDNCEVNSFSAESSSFVNGTTGQNSGDIFPEKK